MRAVNNKLLFLILGLVALLGGEPGQVAQAQPTSGGRPLVFAIIVGNNEGQGILPQLHFADDDALRYYRLATQLASEQNVALLTELDVETWRRLQLSKERPPFLLPPTKKKLQEVIDLFKQQITRERKNNSQRPVHFYFFFSGHGEKGYFLLKKDSALFVDNVFTAEDLERAFADSPATLTSLFIDACKSQSLFVNRGPNDGKKTDDEVGPDFSHLINRLERTAQTAPIGVLTSTLSDRPAGEARDIHGGYFSHVVASGLSGAADANSDGQIEYGELAAFVAFHTRRISGQVPWFRPPAGQMETVLISLKDRPDVLEIPPGLGGHFVFFDESGNNLLLEINKTEEQWSRLIFPAGRYKAAWITNNREQALIASVDLGRSSQRLLRDSFRQSRRLGEQQVPRGEAQGAPPAPEETDLALQNFDVESSGFDQPFTPRIVSTMLVAYQAGRSSSLPLFAGPTPTHHYFSLGYGLFGPPVEPAGSGQGLSLGYAYHFSRPLEVGGHIIYAFSDHTRLSDTRSFRLKRLALQLEGNFVLPLSRWLQIAAGPYLGWQLVFMTSDLLIKDPLNETEYHTTLLTGDEYSLRAGLAAKIRVPIYDGLWAALSGNYGFNLVHQESKDKTLISEMFWRPDFLFEVGYAF